MKKTRLITYKHLLIIFFLPFLGFSQSKRETIESFDVDKNPELKLNLSHAEVIVTTWNKNRVEVKTTLSSETLSGDEAENLFDAHEVKVLGNRERVEITSNGNMKPRDRSFAFRQAPTPPKPPKPNAVFSSPPPPPKPPHPPLHFDFDYEAFKEEGKAYLEKFKQQLDSTDFREEMKSFRDEMMKWKDELAISKDSLFLYRSDLDSLKVYVRTFRTEAQDRFERLKENSEAPNPRGSVKKVIEIKVPKSASYEVDLRHSKLNADVMKNLSANLRYSDFQLKDLLGENSEVQMNYSKLLISSANKLSLNLLYSKKVELVQVNEVNVKSKMSNFKINHLKSKALIDGSYGELVINEIDTDFSLVDIQLEKSTASLKLPSNVNFNFYAKSSNSKFNMNSDLDFKMSKSFDNVIYTSTTKTDNSQTLSLSVNYSTVDLD